MRLFWVLFHLKFQIECIKTNNNNILDIISDEQNNIKKSNSIDYCIDVIMSLNNIGYMKI